MRNLFLSLLMFCFIVSKGQQPAIIPPLPEAASFFKSTDIPVSMYSGLPNISIDFYTIQTKELQIPIRINYNARGIQVAEIASRSGIGWALQYGGMISRQIRGSADETSWGILNHNYYNEVFTDSSARGSLMSDIVNFNVDEFPDQFYFDINGESGKFTIDHNDGNVVLQKFDDIKIIPSYLDDGIVSWLVIDKLGNKYYYGRSKDGIREASDYDYYNKSYSFSDLHGMAELGISQEHPYTAWHLMEIETYLHEKIEFFYEAELGMQWRRSYDKIVPAEEYDGHNNPEDLEPEQVKSFFSNLYSYQYQIEEIRFPGGKVIFESDSIERKDFTNTYALHKIYVKNIKDEVVKSFDFSYFYQHCQDNNNQLAYLKQVDTTAKYRLFLSQIKERNSSGDSLPPYQFEYSNTLLPSRFSNSLDNWGYYNGKSNGQYLTFLTYGNNYINRSVDTALSGAGLLKKMTYPTGGTTSFIYEQNKVMAPAFIDELLFNPNNPIDTVYMGAAIFRDSAFFSDGIYSKVITIGENIAPLTSVRFTFVQPMIGDDPPMDYQVILERLDSVGTYYLFPPDADRQLDLSPGQYRLKVIPPLGNYDPYGYGTAFIASLQWTAIIENPHQLDEGEWYGAGKRIKRVEHKNANDLVSFKEYRYLDSSGKTSGKMFGLPNFCFIQKGIPINGIIAPVVDQYGSMPGSPLTQIQGNSLGYSMVTEFYGDSSVNQGKTVYEFTVDEDAGDYYTFPYHLPIDFEWLRGKPLMTKVYKKITGGFELQKSVQNTYLYAGTDNHPGLFAQPFINMDSAYVYRKSKTLYNLPLFIFTPSNNPITTQDYKIYYQSAGAFDLSSTTEQEYANGQVLTRVTKYAYNYDKHYQPVVQRTLTSKGDSSIITTFRPLDIDVRTSAEEKLVARHRIAPPVKVEAEMKNSFNQVLSKTIKNTVFKDWGDSMVLAEHLQSSINSGPYVNEITYNNYGADGSPQQIASRSGLNEVYVWGYKKQFPVAKVIGSNYNTVVGFVDQNILENAAQYNDTQIRTELNKIRAGLADSMAEVFTYTYKPLVGITSITDQQNRTTYYEYDGFGRLSLIRDQNSYILKKYSYQYADRSEISYGNVQKSGVFTRNNCGTGGVGSTVTYTVYANTFFSTLSQADADQKAQTDINQNGQAYANTNGSCTFYNIANSATFIRNNCTTGSTGSSVTYTVAAGIYTSNISQVDADQKAQDDINQNGQAYANAQGTCTLVCSTSTCSGPQYKCVNGSCEMGYKVFTDSYYDSSAGGNICIYHYEWSDGSWSQDYTQFSGAFSCNVGGPTN